MLPVLYDRIKETTLTSGLGSFQLSGAAMDFLSFEVVGDAQQTWYCVEAPASAQWEVGLGRYNSSARTLSRDTILASSSGGKVNFAHGVKTIFQDAPAYFLNSRVVPVELGEGDMSAEIALSPALLDTDYKVSVTPNFNLMGWWLEDKSVDGFTLRWGNAASAGNNMVVEVKP